MSEARVEKLTEQARQLYEAIVAEGYVSPDHTWEGLTILNLLEVTSSKSYGLLRELERAKLIVRIESPKFDRDDAYYAVPPLGLPRLQFPEHLTGTNQGRIMLARQEKVKAADVNMLTQKVIAEDHDPIVEADQTRAPVAVVDWTKWGTIFTAVSIVVAVILWKYS